MLSFWMPHQVIHEVEAMAELIRVQVAPYLGLGIPKWLGCGHLIHDKTSTQTLIHQGSFGWFVLIMSSNELNEFQ